MTLDGRNGFFAKGYGAGSCRDAKVVSQESVGRKTGGPDLTFGLP
jgi:hypothetical protein